MISAAYPQQPETRWCVRCGETKPLDREHFGKGQIGNTFAHHCRSCGSKVKNRVVTPILDGRALN